MNRHHIGIDLAAFRTPMELQDSIEAANYLADVWAIFWPGELIV